MDTKYLSVSSLTKYIKYKFDNDIHLAEVLLEGELSNFKHHSRGHFYFTLKDQSSQISAMMFASYAQGVKFAPKDGMKVFVKGTVTVYEAGGYYQISVKEMKSDGIGDLYLAFEELKNELAQKGLFRPEHKKPIPRFPKKIGVITSPTGAAVRDIINTISRRYPFCEVILYPALVQGVDAKESVASQIKKANSDALVDTLIIGRGGGSIEDLWAFNERIVANAIFESKIPIISAVGHEIDFTISDFVADLRAATPTAAAELATPSTDSLKEYIKQNNLRMRQIILSILSNYKMRLGNIDKHLENSNPLEKLKNNQAQVLEFKKNLNQLINYVINNKKYQYSILTEKLKVLNPLAIMDKGYSIAKKGDNILRSIKDVQIEDKIVINLKDGTIKAKVEEVNNG